VGMRATLPWSADLPPWIAQGLLKNGRTGEGVLGRQQKTKFGQEKELGPVRVGRGVKSGRPASTKIRKRGGHNKPEHNFSSRSSKCAPREQKPKVKPYPRKNVTNRREPESVRSAPTSLPDFYPEERTAGLAGSLNRARRDVSPRSQEKALRQARASPVRQAWGALS